MEVAPLFIVPARAGSVRIPNKNFTPLAGVTPLQRALRCIRFAQPTPYIIVTGDWCPRHEVREGVTYHRRPEALGTEKASMVDVVLDVLTTYPSVPHQAVVLVQPTQPLRRPEHLLEALRLLSSHPSVASLVQVKTVDKLYRREQSMLVPVLGGSCERDQDGSDTYACDGTAYGFIRSWFMTHKTFRDPHHTFTFIIPPDESCALDTPLDWLIASLRLAHGAR